MLEVDKMIGERNDVESLHPNTSSSNGGTSSSEMESDLSAPTNVEVPPAAQCLGLLQRSESFDALLQYIEEGHEDFLNNSNKYRSHSPGLTAEETWDFSLKTSSSNTNNRASIWLTDTAFLQKLNEFNPFLICDHEVVKIPCPCPSKEVFQICAKCHRVFCSNKCLKFTKDPKPKASIEPESNAATQSSEFTSVTNTSDSEYTDVSSDSKPSVVNTSVLTNSKNERPVQNFPHGPGGFSQIGQRNPSSEKNQIPLNILPNVPYGLRGAPPQCPPGWHPGMPPPNRPPPHMFLPPHLQRPPCPPWGPRPQLPPHPFLQRNSPDFVRSRGVRHYQPMPPMHHSPNNNGLLGPGPPMRPPRVGGFFPPQFPPPQRLQHQSHNGHRPFAPPNAGDSQDASKVLRDPHPNDSNQTSSWRTITTSSGTDEPTRVTGQGGWNKTPGSGSSNSSPSKNVSFENKSRGPLTSLDSSSSQQQNPQAPWASRFANSAVVLSQDLSKSNTTTEESAASIRLQQPVISPKRKFPFKPNDTAAPTLLANNIRKIDRDVNFKKFPISQKPFIPFGVPIQVGFSFGTSFMDFYVYSGEGNESNHKVAQFLSTQQTLVPFNNPKVGDYCIAKYTNPDEQLDGWHRARIDEIMLPKIKVYFIDYGNQHTVGLDSIKQIPPSLLLMRPSSMRISIGDFQPMMNKVEELELAFSNFIFDSWIRATIYENTSTVGTHPTPKHKARLEIKYEEQWHEVAHILEGDLLGKKIIFAEGLNRTTLKPVDESPILKTKCEIPIKVSHVNNLNDFYVVPTSSLPDKEKISRCLNGVDSAFVDLALEKLLGTNYICIAQRKAQWVRAKIIQITQEWNAEIRFLDYGDTTTLPLKDLKMIPEELLKIPQLAHRCSLPIFPVEGTWDQAEADFRILNQLMEIDGEIVVVVFAVEVEVAVHIVEIFIGKTHSGLTKSLLKKKSEFCSLEYTVNLEIRQTLQPLKETTNVLDDKSQTPKRLSANVPVIEQKPPQARAPSPPKSKVFPEQSPTKTISSLLPEPKMFSVEQRPTHTMASLPSSSTPEPKDLLAKQSKSSQQETKLASEDSFSACNLKPTPKLGGYIGEDFQISEVVSYNKMHIRPIKNIEIEKFLQDDIHYECIDSGNVYEEPPPINTILIVKCPDDDNYHRGMVEKITKHHITIMFIDYGRKRKLNRKTTLIPASKAALKYPKLSYEVILAGVEEDPSLLLFSDFQNVLLRIMKDKFSLESCLGECEPYTVELRTKGASAGDTISKRILASSIWEWERVWDSGNLTELQLLEKIQQKDKFPPKEEHLEFQGFDPASIITGTISRASSEGDIFIVNIKDREGIFWRNHLVLQNQIARYVKKVGAANFFPMMGELILIYLPDIPELRAMGVFGIGKWNRCVKETQDYYRNVDYDEVYPADVDLSKNFVIRKLAPDFLRVPRGIISCFLTGFKPSLPLVNRIQNELTAKKIVKCKVDHYDKENVVHFITIDGFSF